MFDVEHLLNALRKGNKDIPIDMAWKGESVSTDDDLPEDIHDPILAIATAKQRARGNNTRQITCRSSIVIGEGKGRATRELELLWWPDLYDDEHCGKMCLRFYVSKVRFA